MAIKRKKVFNGVCIFIVVSFFVVMAYMYFAALKVNKDEVNKGNIGIDSKGKIKQSLIVGYCKENESDTLYCVGILSTGGTKQKELRFTGIYEKTEVNLEGHDKKTFGDLYKEGGTKLLMKEVNSTFGLNIDNYILIDFSKIDKVVDAIGSITLPLSIEDALAIGGSIKTGDQNLNGEQVKKYYSDRGITDSSFNSEARYIKVICNIIDKALKENFFKAPIDLLQAKDAITTNFSNTDIVLKISALIGKPYKFQTLVVPVQNTFSLQLQQEPNIYYIKWDTESNKKILYDFVVNGFKPTGIN